jgi:hypothetical protein
MKTTLLTAVAILIAERSLHPGRAAKPVRRRQPGAEGVPQSTVAAHWQAVRPGQVGIRLAMVSRRLATTTLAPVVVAAALTACVHDHTIQLRALADSRIERLAGAQPVTVFRFADRRGDEGDGDPHRVGGMYDGYGARLARVFSATPWPDSLVESLVAGFDERGVRAVAVPDRELAPGATAVSTPFAVAGEIHNFSTETRWTLQAHVSGVVRLYDNRGNLLLTRSVSARIPRDAEAAPLEPSVSGYQASLNLAVRQFVHAVVMDPELSQRLAAPRAVHRGVAGTAAPRATLGADDEGRAGPLRPPDPVELHHHRQPQSNAAQGPEHRPGR